MRDGDVAVTRCRVFSRGVILVIIHAVSEASRCCRVGRTSSDGISSTNYRNKVKCRCFATLKAASRSSCCCLSAPPLACFSFCFARGTCLSFLAKVLERARYRHVSRLGQRDRPRGKLLHPRDGRFLPSCVSGMYLLSLFHAAALAGRGRSVVAWTERPLLKTTQQTCASDGISAIDRVRTKTSELPQLLAMVPKSSTWVGDNFSQAPSQAIRRPRPTLMPRENTRKNERFR